MFAEGVVEDWAAAWLAPDFLLGRPAAAIPLKPTTNKDSMASKCVQKFGLFIKEQEKALYFDYGIQRAPTKASVLTRFNSNGSTTRPFESNS